MAGNLKDIIPALFTGAGGERLTQEQIAQRNLIAQSLFEKATDTSPNAGGWASVLSKGLMGYKSGADTRAADAAIKANADASQQSIAQMLGSLTGGGASYPAAVAAGASPTSAAAIPSTAAANFNFGDNKDALRAGIIETAQAIGADPLDLATAISYETAGTFDPTKRGPTTQWGQHRGLIQFGEPQARQYGVNWEDPLGSQLGANGAVANYFRSSGFKPGMSGLDLYSTINAGAPGKYNASDANNGGAPGSVADKWNNQMGDHREKAMALLGSDMSSGQQAINAIAPQVDVTDTVVTPNGFAQVSDDTSMIPNGGVASALLAQNDMAMGGALAPAAASQQPVMQQPQPQGGMGAINPAIIQALSDPYASPQQQQIASLLLNNQMQQAQAQQAQAQALAQRQSAAQGLGINPNMANVDDETWKAMVDQATRNRNTVIVGNTVYDANTGQPVIQGQASPTSDIQNFEYARGNGYQGSFADYQQEVKRAGAMNVDARQMGNIPPGYKVDYNPAGQPISMSPIPGSPDYIKAQKELEAFEQGKISKDRTSQVVTQDIDRAMDLIDKSPFTTTGVAGTALSKIGGTASNDVNQLITTIKANAGFDRLQAMRDASPTGGALGAVSERELTYLQSTIGSLDQSQTKEQLIRNLQRVRQAYSDIIDGPKQQSETQQEGWKDLGNGVRIRAKGGN